MRNKVLFTLFLGLFFLASNAQAQNCTLRVSVKNQTHRMLSDLNAFTRVSRIHHIAQLDQSVNDLSFSLKRLFLSSSRPSSSCNTLRSQFSRVARNHREFSQIYGSIDPLVFGRSAYQLDKANKRMNYSFSGLRGIIRRME